MQNDNLISVIIPVYNVAKYLECCLNSVINQTYPFIEIILVDDGSIDGSGQICDNFATKDKRIQVIHTSNRGLVSARKTGIQAALGKYIVCVDSDDWVEPNMLGHLYKTLKEQKVDIAMCGYYEVIGNKSKPIYHGLPEGKYDKELLLKNVYPNMMVNERFFEWGIIPGLVAKLFKKEAVINSQLEVPDQITMGEDAACVYPCLLSVNSIYVIHECYYYYRQILTSMVKRLGDPDSERNQYKIMYQYTKSKLMRFRGVYDCLEQWDKYVLFLMFQRADALYRDLHQLDFLFPFPTVKKGERIVLYGAGTYGQRLYKYLKKTGFCEVVGWVDRNYEELTKLGLAVSSPDIIPELQYHHIIIAITYASTREGAYHDLTNKYGKEKVVVIDEEIILSEKSKKAFGLSVS